MVRSVDVVDVFGRVVEIDRGSASTDARMEYDLNGTAVVCCTKEVNFVACAATTMGTFEAIPAE